MANYCREYGTICEIATDLGFCSVTACIKQNRVSNILTICTDDTHAPMVEYAPVVRCKDCKHQESGKNEKWCELMPWKELNPDWFCADGERREKE